MYKISVIMPIYNAEKYLRGALDSVVNQSFGFENIELILVDDRSTDNSRNIVMEYSNKYSNIKPIFLEENSGCPGIPRNVGIENTTSDYIMFIDNDDEYLPEICENLYNTIILEDSDIVVCNPLYTDIDGSTIEISLGGGNSEKVIFGEEIIYFANIWVWNCIFKKSIILDNDLWFVDGAFEDGIFVLEYSIHSKKLVHLSNFSGYHSIQRENSASNFSLNRAIECINALYLCYEILKENNGDLYRFFRNRIVSCIREVIFSGNLDEIKIVLSNLYDFESEINFKGKLSIGFNLINFFILRGDVNIAAYIALFMSMIVKSNFILNIYRKFFLKN